LPARRHAMGAHRRGDKGPRPSGRLAEALRGPWWLPAALQLQRPRRLRAVWLRAPEHADVFLTPVTSLITSARRGRRDHRLVADGTRQAARMAVRFRPRAPETTPPRKAEAEAEAEACFARPRGAERPAGRRAWCATERDRVGWLGAAVPARRRSD